MKIGFPLVKTLSFLVITSVLLACGGAPAYDVEPTGDPTSSSSSSSSSSSGQRPSIKIGIGGGGSFTEGSGSSELIATTASSVDWTINVVIVDESNLAVTDSFDVSFSSSCTLAGLSSLSSDTVTTEAGRASVSYSSGDCSGVDTVVATVTHEGISQSATVDLNIDEARSDVGGAIPRMGAGSGSEFVEGLLGVSSIEIAAGGSEILSLVIVDDQGNLVNDLPSGTTVSFASTCVSSGLASFSPSATPEVVAGAATVTYRAEGCSGSDTVRAQYVYSGSGTTVLNAEVALNIAVDNVLGLQFESASESALAIAGVGGQETSVVTFQLVGAQGAPIVGEQVSFELSNTAGGTQLASGTESDISDNSGFVTTVVQSGTVNSTTRVVANHDASGIRGFSEDITISTGVPVSRSFDLSYTPFNPLAANVNGVEVQITAHVTDQFGNPPPDDTQVSFRSVEGGSVEPSCSLVNGTCSVTWTSSGDRDAITPDESGRGHRVTVIGFMSGAEDYVDQNGNGFFDPDNAEEVNSLVDLGEAYVDQNENGSFDSGEDFVDSFLNQSGTLNRQRDSASAGGDDYTEVYNGPCSSLLRSDCPPSQLQSVTVFDSVVISMSSEFAAVCSFGSLPLPDSGLPIQAANGVMLISGLEICDINGNSMPEGTTIRISGFGGGENYEVPNNTTEPYPIGVLLTDENDTSGLLTIEVTSETRQTTVFSWQWVNTINN